MRPSEIRRELLDQHLQIRIKMREARRIAERAARSGRIVELREAILRVSALLHAHNLREEELMTEVFPTLDAWGLIRAEVMIDEHVDEHRDLQDALASASTTEDARVAAAKAYAVFDQILDHMKREEKVFLGEDVLSDAAQVVDYFGGE